MLIRALIFTSVLVGSVGGYDLMVPDVETAETTAPAFQTLTTADHNENLLIPEIPATIVEDLAWVAQEEARIAAEAAAAEAVRVAAEAEQARQTAAQRKASFPAPPAVTPNPGSAQDEAWGQVQARGWGQDQFNCLVALWNKESGWRVNAMNSSSGAYGIPQSLPGNKMASAGADWQTNPATQITWGLNYITARYGLPCAAWDHSGQVGWY